jgi:hypothetical protein
MGARSSDMQCLFHEASWRLYPPQRCCAAVLWPSTRFAARPFQVCWPTPPSTLRTENKSSVSHLKRMESDALVVPVASVIRSR